MNQNPNLAQTMWCKATLQYPTVPQLPLESVGDMLNKASNLATTANFQWSFIDKPADGSIFLVYIQSGTPVPPDGFMYMDAEQPYSMSVGGKLVEIWEHKYGFIPGQEQFTSRTRRRFRLGGKNPHDVAASLWIVFYSRTHEEIRVAANPMVARPQPMRKYPLPNINTKPFNLFQAMPGVAQMPNNQQQSQQQYQMAQMQQIQAQQAHNMAMQAHQGGPPPPHLQQQQQQQQQQHVPPQQGYRPLQTPQQGYTSPYASGGSIHQQKRTTPSQHLPPDVVARMQRGETLADGAATHFEDPAGDLFDTLSPLDISRARFVRHHDWMEEIFSAYPTHRIKSDLVIPDELGEEVLKSQIERYERETEETRKKYEAMVDAIRRPQGEAGRVKAELEKLASKEDANGLETGRQAEEGMTSPFEHAAATNNAAEVMVQ